MQSRWALLEPLRARLADEQGTISRPGPMRVALCYPSPYHVGMSSLGFQTIYRELNEQCDALRTGAGKREMVERLARRPGFWAPGLQASPPPVVKADDDRLPARSQIVTPHTELRNMFLIEPERGCSRGCTYCVMRRTTNGGMRTVDPERVLELLPEDARRVGLVGAAVTDHPRIVELVRRLVDDGREVGISSLRADRLCARPELISLLAQSGARTLTTAADGASERLRTALDRRTTAAQLVRVAGLAREAGFQRLKLYLMVGLPGEEDSDLDELVEMAGEISRILPLSFGCAPFVAKRNTPMDGTRFVPVEETERRIAYLRAKLRGRAEIRPTSPRWAWVEYMLAQGGEDAGHAALEAWRAGASFAAWKRAFRERGVRPRGERRVADGRLRLPQLAAWPVL